MKILLNILFAIVVITGVSVMPTVAQVNRANNKQTRNLLNRIEQRTNTFKIQLNRSLDNGSLNQTKSEDYINNAVSDFENAADKMKENYINGSNITSDVRDVLSKANYIENIMRDYSFDKTSKSTWNLLRVDLTTLARYYNVSWNWNNTNFPVTNSGLTGTYRLNLNQSDDVNAVIELSLADVSNNQREKMRENLQRRFAVPDYLAIERLNNMVTLSSSNAEKTTFEATGKTLSERLPNGNKLNTNAAFYGDRLVINSDGDKSNAFYISFEPVNKGEKLRVTRRLNLEKRDRTVTVVSTYNRTSNVAQWNGYPENNSTVVTTNNNTFYIPNQTAIKAVLSNNLSTKKTLVGDRFLLTISQPLMYEGAVIEGTVDKVSRSGRLTGSAELNLNFETIRLPNGRTHRFEALIDKITTQDGKTINIDNEDMVKGSSQTKDTVIRSGIGGIIGAIIGGIAGGGKGAGIGAVIGAGAGGGSVLIKGRDDIELFSGTSFEITSSSPANTANFSN
jgi:ribosomal protein S8